MTKVFCKFVNAEVEQDDLNEHCDEMIIDGNCTADCKPSPQLEYGVPVAHLLANFTRKETK